MRRLALWTLAAALLAAVCFVLPPAIQAQGIEGIPDCEYPDAEYYQAGVFPRYEAPGQRVVLVSFYTGADVMALDTGVEVERFYGLGWSEDCRYVAVSMGSPDSLDTVVYDVAEARRVGVVPDAHRQPHAITWGPEAYLVVETRNGGILWDVEANTQTLLTTSWNTTTIRNFSRLRWDAANGQLIANLAVGGRDVYDLATGQELDVAANIASPLSFVAPEALQGQVVIGGKPYACRMAYRYGYPAPELAEGEIDDLAVRYDSDARTVYIALDELRGPDEVIQMVEGNVIADSFHFRGWAPGCRYFAASLGIPGEDATDTVVWDVLSNRRVGAFEDARQIEHPIHWSPTGDALVVETRQGAYLWVLPTNTPYLLTSAVETALAGRSGIRTFYDLEWNAESGQLFIVPLDAENEVHAYAIATGARLGTYPTSNRAVPPELLPASTAPVRTSYGEAAVNQTLVPATPLEGTSGLTRYSWRIWWRWQDAVCDGLLARYEYQNQRRLALVDRTSGEIVRVLDENLNSLQHLTWSPDCRYFGAEVSWASNAPEPYDDRPIDDSEYAVSDTLVFWDVLTGERAQEFSHPYREETYTAIWWSPDNDRALVRTTTGHYLWHPASHSVVLLTFKNPANFSYGRGSDITTYASTYWDYERGQLLVTGGRAVYAFDMQTGMERYQFTAGPRGGGSSLSVDETNQWLFVAGALSAGVWNLDTLEHAYLDVDDYGGAYLGRRIAISPDGRFVAMAFNTLRIWDLSTTPDEGGLIPVGNRLRITQNRSLDSSLRFLDATTVEAFDSYGNVQRWNVLTGEELPVG